MGVHKVGQRYSEEFKNNAVQMVIIENKTPREVADEIKVRISVLNNWLVKSLLVENRKLETENDKLKREMARKPAERLRELETENAKLKEQIDALTKTIGIISK